jgi:uncharacterized repeat protein (TIGR03806 family)
MRRLILLLFLACLCACSDGKTGGGGPPPPGLTTRETVSGLTFPINGGATGALTRAFPNLTFSRPVFITHAGDGTDRLFVVEQAGTIRVFANQDSVPQATTFLDITGRVLSSGSEQGLLGLAFDPNYASNGFFYAHYTAASPTRSVIARFRVSANPDVADPASETLVLQVNQPFDNHNAGMLAFGPDGFLYVAMGDGGSGSDPQDNGQDLGTLLGALLRIDVSALPYTVPGSNPFVGTGGAQPEIWAYGLRNPWRFSFDRTTGELLLGDVGQGQREEVNVVRAGDNLGWRVREGTIDHINPGGLPASNFVGPLIDYGRSSGASVIGGHVYRGTAIAGFQGTYVYGDYVSGNVWALTRDAGGAVTSNQVIGSLANVSSFGEDRDGELYAVAHTTGQVWRLTAGGGAAAPTTLSASGLFADTAALDPAAGVVEYDVQIPFWSDGAVTRHWIALPGTTTIGFDATDAWTLPVGAVLAQHFELEVSPGVFRRLETRVLVRQQAGWAGYTYAWNAGQTDATLVANGGQTLNLTVTDSNGTRAQTYQLPSRAECLRCHTGAAGTALSLRTRQLNRAFAYPTAVDNQLRAWNHIGLFDRDIGDPSQYAAYPDLQDAQLDLEARARAYLHVNCAHCHLSGGPTPVADMDLSIDTLLGATNTLDVRPTEGGLGLFDPYRIRGGVKSDSVLWERLRLRGNEQMPPVVSTVPDAFGVDLIGDWIDGL